MVIYCQNIRFNLNIRIHTFRFKKTFIKYCRTLKLLIFLEKKEYFVLCTRVYLSNWKVPFLEKNRIKIQGLMIELKKKTNWISGQSVLAPPNNNTVVLLIQNLYFSTNLHFRLFVFSGDNTNLYYRGWSIIQICIINTKFVLIIQLYYY